MADELELKQQIDSLFVDLRALTKINSPDRLAQEPDAHDYILQLLGLFSEPGWPVQTETGLPAAGQDDVVTLLTSRNPTERSRAVQNLTQLQSEWAIDPLLYAAADTDENVARQALEGLLWLGKAVNERLLALAEQPENPLHKGGTLYLSYLVGQPFVHVPTGAFLMGSDPATDPLAEENEQPQHQLRLPGYWISRYPVTAQQYQDFLRESSYRPRHNGRTYGEPDYPAVDITWFDALAYCDWLTRRSGLPVSLPSEAEWEKAARGLDGRRYPWGSQPPTEDLCSLTHSTPVGQYSPQGDSPFGCADMVGNVWEWTRSAYEIYPYDPADGRESLTGEEARVVKGLTFNNAERYTRCAYRYRLKPILHLQVLGFRVVVAPRPQPI